MSSRRVVLPREGKATPGLSPFWEKFRDLAALDPKTQLFPEATDPRVISAAHFLNRNKLCRPVLVGNPGAVGEAAARMGLSLEGVPVLDPAANPDREAYARQLFEKRKSKGMTEDQAKDLVFNDALFFAAMALQDGKAHGLVGGAVRTTADTVRAGFSCVGVSGTIAFGAFFMECPHAPGGTKHILFADSAVSPHPSPRFLAGIAAEAARVYNDCTKETPRVAFLSFSTRGSAEDESVSQVREAVELARRKNPDLILDGEIQGDAALDSDIALQKGMENSGVAGRANVLIFPDLNAGNIAYKLVQHLGGARAVGPLLVGLKKPMTDLSRGCNDEDIVDAAVLTALMS